MNWLQIVGSLLLIIGCADNPLKCQMKVKWSITAERQRALLIYYLYKAIHMDALILTVVMYLLVTVNDFHHLP